MSWPGRLSARLSRKTLDVCGRGLAAVGVQPVSLAPESVLAAASRRGGGAGFGEPTFVPGLERLLRACDEEGRLTISGRRAVRGDCVRMLLNRQRLHACLRRDSTIAAQRIERPIVITGLPRTGTTLLHWLLARDPAHRFVSFRDCLYPAPWSDAADDDALRLRAAEQGLRRLHELAPRLNAIHPMVAAGPEECVHLIMHEFSTVGFSVTAQVPGYVDWALRQDQRPGYRLYRRFLQLLQSDPAERRWVLKSPVHLFALDVVLEQFPDALIVHTHRDPLAVIPSQCSLVRTMRRLGSYAVDPTAIGAEAAGLYAHAIAAAMRVREQSDPERFVDLHFSDLVADPLRAVSTIYARLGELPGADALQDMRRWLSGNAWPASRHRYTLEEYGLDAATERRRFGAYTERFGVASS